MRHRLSFLARVSPKELRIRRWRCPAAGAKFRPALGTRESSADPVWISKWRACVLRRVREPFEQHERKAPCNIAFTALRLAADYPDEDSAALTALAAAAIGQSLRSRRIPQAAQPGAGHFALIVDAIRRTLAKPRSKSVLEELAELGLMMYVRDYLPKLHRGTVKRSNRWAPAACACTHERRQWDKVRKETDSRGR